MEGTHKKFGIIRPVHGQPGAVQVHSYSVTPWASRFLKRSVALSVVHSVSIMESREPSLSTATV